MKAFISSIFAASLSSVTASPGWKASFSLEGAGATRISDESKEGLVRVWSGVLRFGAALALETTFFNPPCLS
jgi:hypothetical protein